MPEDKDREKLEGKERTRKSLRVIAKDKKIDKSEIKDNYSKKRERDKERGGY